VNLPQKERICVVEGFGWSFPLSTVSDLISQGTELVGSVRYWKNKAIAPQQKMERKAKICELSSINNKEKYKKRRKCHKMWGRSWSCPLPGNYYVNYCII
jgi:hypothetical protein